MKINFYIGCFIALFLIFFQPFGNAEWNTDYKYLKLAGYGFISFFAPSAYQFLLLKTFKVSFNEERWTILKEVIWLIGIISVITVGNVIYSYFLGITSLSINTLIYTFLITCSLGVFPVIASIIFKYHRYKTLNESNAKIMDNALINYRNRSTIKSTIHDISLIQLIAENKKDTLQIPNDDLLYLESLDNYTQIVYITQEGLEKQMLRGSLSSFEAQISSQEIIRCHRSYIVNISNATEIEGNAQGYKISLRDCKKIVPVSRSYGKEILELWSKN
jgi:hypothetical protein